MATITENIQTMFDCRDAIKQAIIDKGGEVGDLTTYAAAIAHLPGGGGGSTSPGKNDVNFYDYDGTILHSYSKDEFLALTQFPDLPTQPGLTCQGWNYDIKAAKVYVGDYGKLDIGATYITDDGNTRLYIKIAEEGRMTVPLYFNQSVAKGVIIDWGDGSAAQTLSGTGNKSTSHTYANIGDYCIALTVSSDCTLGLGHNSSSYGVIGSTGYNGRVYCNMLQKVEIGTGVTNIRSYSFQYCYSLASVVIPNSVTSIGSYAFNSCLSLASVVIPNSVASIGIYSFQFCYSLASVVIPNSVTSIGNYSFGGCYSLASVVIPNSVASTGGYSFQTCYSLASVVIPNSIIYIGASAFNSCYSLASVVIPNSVTGIGSSAFNNCYSLASVVIPNNVTSIEGSAFRQCYGVAYYDFSNHTDVPTLANTDAFSNIQTDCKIIVPDNLYDTWIAATNWSTYSSKIIKKSEWDAL